MRKTLIVIGVVLLILAVLFCPFLYDTFEDGGTKDLRALTYRVIEWNPLDDEELCGTTSLFLFPENLKDYEELKSIAHERLHGK